MNQTTPEEFGPSVFEYSPIWFTALLVTIGVICLVSASVIIYIACCKPRKDSAYLDKKEMLDEESGDPDRIDDPVQQLDEVSADTSSE